MQVTLKMWLAFSIAKVTKGHKDFEKASIHHLMFTHRKWLHKWLHNFDSHRKKGAK